MWGWSSGSSRSNTASARGRRAVAQNSYDKIAKRMLSLEPFKGSRNTVATRFAHDQDHEDQSPRPRSRARAPAGQSKRSRPSAEIKLRGPQAPPARDQRSRGGRLPARLGPGHLYAEARRCCASPPGRDAAHAGTRTVRRSGAGQAARRASTLCRQPARRRREHDPRCAARLREGDQDPADYVKRKNELGSASFDAWTRARPANDFATMRPFLEKILDLSREYADFFAPYRACRRSADRRRRRRHDDDFDPHALRRAQARDGADRACDIRSIADRRRLPARPLRRSRAARFRPLGCGTAGL